jgi:hypothetical protein
MSDRERDQIDQDAQTFIRTCSTAIQSLKDGGLLLIQCYSQTSDFDLWLVGQSGKRGSQLVRQGVC